MDTNVVGLFEDQRASEGAVEDLIQAGFERGRISVITRDPEGEQYERYREREGKNLGGEGAVTGLASGAVVGGFIGLLVGIGVIFVPTGFLAAGAIAGLITGTAAGAATGGIAGGLIGIGIPHHDADIYAESVRRGGILISVRADDLTAAVAHRILDRDGAVNIDDRSAWYREHGFLQFDPDAPAFTDEEVHRERERNALLTGAIDQATVDRIRRYAAFDGDPDARPGPYADLPKSDLP